MIPPHNNRNPHSFLPPYSKHLIVNNYSIFDEFFQLQNNLLIAHIQSVTKRYGTNFRTHSPHLEDKIMLNEHGSGNALFPCQNPFSPTLHSTWGKCTLGYVWLTYKIIIIVGHCLFTCNINCFSDQNELGKHTVYCVEFITDLAFCINAEGGHFEHLL